MSNLPNVPSNLAQQLRDFLQSVRIILLDLSARIANLSARVSQLNGVAYLAKSYVDNVTDDASIDPPSNLVVEVVSWVHKLTWNNIDSTKVSGVEVFHNTTNDVSTAELLATVPYGVEVYRHSVDSVYVDHYYWIRNVTWGGGYSTYVPDPTIHGGYLIERDESIGEAIDQAMNLLIGDDPPLYSAATVYDAGDIVKWAGDDGVVRRYRRKNYDIGNSNVDPSNGSYWERLGLLVEGKIDGAPTLGVDGNLVVDGTILARHIKADEITGDHINAHSKITLDEGGQLIVGDNNIILDSVGNTLIVSNDGGPYQSNPPTGWLYTKMDRGNFSHGFYDGNNLVELQSVRVVDGGGPIKCNTSGYYDITTTKRFINPPQILLSPALTPTYRKDLGTSYDLDAELIVESLQQNSNYTWTFRVRFNLIYGSTQISSAAYAPTQSLYQVYNWVPSDSHYNSYQETITTLDPANFLPAGVTWNRITGTIGIYTKRQKTNPSSYNNVYGVSSNVYAYLNGSNISLGYIPGDTITARWHAYPDGQPSIISSGAKYYNFDIATSGNLTWGAKSYCGPISTNYVEDYMHGVLWCCHLESWLSVTIYTDQASIPVAQGTFNWLAIGD